VDASIASIREGRSSTRWRARRAGRTRVGHPTADPARSTETYYLMELMASHEFQTALHNYLDLEDLRSKLSAWKTGLDAFEE
jgi:hypothetical protein